MLVDKVVEKVEKKNLNIIGARLLTVDEARTLPDEIIIYKDWWWLGSRSELNGRAPLVQNSGNILYIGIGVYNSDICVRPALIIENNGFEKGDRFTFGGKRFEIVNNELAFCLSDIGQSCFRKKDKPMAKDISDYEVSDVKKFVDKWFKEATE